MFIVPYYIGARAPQVTQTETKLIITSQHQNVPRFGHHKDGLAIREHPFGKGFRNRWRLSESRTCSPVDIIAHPNLVR